MKLARYFISSLGIIIGVAIAIIILGVAEGGMSVLNNSFWEDNLKAYEIELSDKATNEKKYLNWDDGKLLVDKMPSVKYSIPVLGQKSQLKSYKASESAYVLGVNAKYLKYSNLEVLKGRFITDEDVLSVNRVAVLDDYTALELFGTTDIVGQKLEIKVDKKNIEFIISGVIKNSNRKIDNLFSDEFPSLCFIPNSVSVDVAFNYNTEKIIALIDASIHDEEAKIKLEHLLEREHQIEDVYNIKEYNQLFIVREYMDNYMIFAMMISALSLLLGGIGLMNAVLLTIQERRKEIGLYKLFGSEIREIQYEFILRVLVISIWCAILGLVLGLLLANIIGSFINVKVRLTLMLIFVSLALSTITAILSSLYPTSRINMVDVAEIIWESD